MLLALSGLQLAKYLYPEGLAFSHVRSINISDNATHTLVKKKIAVLTLNLVGFFSWPTSYPTLVFKIILTLLSIVWNHYVFGERGLLMVPCMKPWSVCMENNKDDGCLPCSEVTASVKNI